MNEDFFWSMLRSSKNESRKIFIDSLTGDLSNLSQEDINQFEIILTQKLRELCTWDCFGALLAIETVTDDEHSDDFRSWIISEGKDFFDAFKRDADSMASKLYEKSELYGDLTLQSLQLVTSMAMKIRIGSDNYTSPRYNAFTKGFTYGSTNELIGAIVYETDLPKRFSKIWALFQN